MRRSPSKTGRRISKNNHSEPNKTKRLLGGEMRRRSANVKRRCRRDGSRNQDKTKMMRLPASQRTSGASRQGTGSQRKGQVQMMMISLELREWVSRTGLNPGTTSSTETHPHALTEVEEDTEEVTEGGALMAVEVAAGEEALTEAEVVAEGEDLIEEEVVEEGLTGTEAAAEVEALTGEV